MVVGPKEDKGESIGMTPKETLKVEEKFSISVNRCVSLKMGPLICDLNEDSRLERKSVMAVSSR